MISALLFVPPPNSCARGKRNFVENGRPVSFGGRGSGRRLTIFNRAVLAIPRGCQRLSLPVDPQRPPRRFNASFGIS